MKSALLALTCMVAGCTSLPTSPDPMASQVAELVNRATSPGEERTAFAGLEALGSAAVPYMVGHLGDTRLLPEREISLANSSPAAFEGLRHYSPETVHDALAAILNHVTGQSFVAVYNGASPRARQINMVQWQAWCAREFPKESIACSPQ